MIIVVRREARRTIAERETERGYGGTGRREKPYTYAFHILIVSVLLC